MIKKNIKIVSLFVRKLKKWFLDLFFTFNKKRSILDIFINLYCAKQNYLLINLWFIKRDCFLYGEVLNINYFWLSVDIRYYIADGCTECENIKLRDIFSAFATNGDIKNHKIGKVFVKGDEPKRILRG